MKQLLLSLIALTSTVGLCAPVCDQLSRDIIDTASKPGTTIEDIAERLISDHALPVARQCVNQQMQFNYCFYLNAIDQYYRIQLAVSPFSTITLANLSKTQQLIDIAHCASSSKRDPSAQSDSAA